MADDSGATAFVTGATGFLGLNLVDELITRGWAVTALHRAGSNLGHLKRFAVTLAEGDVTDAAAVMAAMPGDMDAVFHVAGNTSHWSGDRSILERVNRDGARNVAAAALEKGAKRFIHTSSISAWGRLAGDIDENTPQKGAESWIDYERTKWLGEQEIKAAIGRGLDAVILNPAAIIGPYDTRNWARLFFLLRDDKLPGVPSGRGHFCHVREVARAHIEAFARGRKGENYLLGGVVASFHQLAVLMARALAGADGTARKIKQLPTPLLRVIAKVNQLASVITRRAPDLTPEVVEVTARPHTIV